MIKHIFALILITAIPFITAAQEKKDSAAPTPAGSSKKQITDLPAQSVVTKDFEIKHVSFNKKIDLKGRGEILEVEFELSNNTDLKHEFYVFVIATFDDLIYQYNSFNDKKLNMEKNEIKYFVPVPEDMSLYEYESAGKKEIRKFPNKPTAGINPANGKPYLLEKNLVIRTTHLSNYRKNYTYFNRVSIIIFDKEQELTFAQSYEIKGSRKR